MKAVAVGLLFALVACDGAVSLSSSESPLPWQPPEATTILSITLDDAFASQLDAARILEGGPGTAPEDSFRGTFFVISGQLRRPNDPPSDSPPRMSPEDVRALAAAGHEIGGHTLLHLPLDALAITDPYEMRRQVCNDRRILEGLIGRITGFAYPKSDDEGAHEAVTECGYAYGRDAGGLAPPTSASGVSAETVPPLDRTAIRVIPSVAAGSPDPVRASAATAAGMIAWIEGVRARGGGWVVMTLHHVRPHCTGLGYCMTTGELEALVAWLRTRPPGVAVRTMDQVMLGDPLVGNPSMEQLNTGATPHRPLCFKRDGSGTSFRAADEPRQAFTGSYAEVMSPVNWNRQPEIGIDRTGKGCSLPVTVGRRYQVRAYVRAESGAATAHMTVRWQTGGLWGAEPVAPSAVGPDAPVTGEWTQLSWVTPPAPVGTTAMTFGVRYGSNGGAGPAIAVDDFSVVER